VTPESVIVTTTEDKYFLDCIEQFCADDQHAYVQWYNHEERQVVTREILGKILSVVIV